ncbi:hypothetical protein C7974DRAFT_433253 [Boeremia exigua]|uniref:uncharacterized protein n=1 Tax=Boeremia exigua TaxID=749465 RepID=UPI001E8E749F|nr:uncharacterized protein C7974DRAFT_433253 [Boeremia exigua]KAH6633083.1 hypothetical protein C7974DRAFT_433253 [Boeremia exigua]
MWLERYASPVPPCESTCRSVSGQLTLQQEQLIDHISSFLTSEDLENTLTVNRAYNAAAERLSGTFSSFDLTEHNSQTFITIYGGPRLRQLYQVVFRTSFPPILDAAVGGLACRETTQELQEKDECFSSQIGLLFSTLKAAELRAAKPAPRRTKIVIHSPTRQIGKQMLRGCRHRMDISWRVRLLAPESLPELRFVRSLQVDQGDPTITPLRGTEISKLDLRMIVDLAKKLPNLEFVGCQLGQGEVCPKYVGRSRFWAHYENDWEGPRRDTRHHFAEAVESFCLPSTMERVRLDFLDNYDMQIEHLDQRDDMPDLVGPAKRDPFSSSLCTLSHSLRILELRGIVDSNLFERHCDDQTPWPNLESLEIMFWPISPSGAWYFQGPNGEGGQSISYSVTEDHYPPLGPNTNDVVHDEYLEDRGRSDDNTVGGAGFRITPNDRVLVPFLTAFARAASRMPKLKDASVWCPLVCYRDEEGVSLHGSLYEHLNDLSLAWGITYDKPSLPTPRKLAWRVSTWRPDEKLHVLFRDIGRIQHGDELEEEWTDDQTGDDLVSREFFSYY